MYKRNCPNCGIEIVYKTKHGFIGANNNTTLCSKCNSIQREKNRKLAKQYKRQCPKCNRDMFYTNLKGLNNSIIKNTVCPSCAAKFGINQNKIYKKQCPECNKDMFYASLKGLNKSIFNNKKCTSCIAKISQNTTLQKQKLIDASSGKNNSMYGKSFYDIWIKKYGKEIADKKLANFKEKQSKNNKGENNSMYGKPAPQGSGNGWSGHYLGYYFRSLLELSYLKYLIDNNIKFESAEKSKYIIHYEINGIAKTYRPDYYLIDTEEIIEIKPKKLVNSYINKCKFKAAIEKWQDKFKTITENEIQLIDLELLYKMHLNKDVVFDNRYIKKIEEYYKNQNK